MDIYSPNVLVIPRNRWLRLNMTEKLFTRTLNKNQNKQTQFKWINNFLCYRQQQVNGVNLDWAPVVSVVPQGTVIGHTLFSLHINDVTADIESEIRLFAHDCGCYRKIEDKEDTLKLQRDIDR